jgi:hypothetical protein
MIEVELPDGRIIEFPDGTTPDVMKSVAAKAADSPQTQAPVDVRGSGGGRGTALEAALIGARQGVTLGFGDEGNAAVRAAGDWLGNPFRRGDGQPFGESYDKRLAHERTLLGQTEAENPKSMLGGEIAGSVMLPGGAVKATTVAGAAGKGALAAGAFGGVAGAGNAEGGMGERAKGAATGAAFGSLFGAGAGATAAVGTKAFRTAMGRVAKAPTVEGLKVAKNLAYKAVDDAGEVFSPGELQGMVKAANESIDGLGSYVPDVDKQTAAALTILERNAKGPMTLGQLDKIRQGLWKRLEAAPNEVGIHDAIDAIDDLVQSRGATSELMDAARLANAQFKKAELLENAFKKAQDQTSATGSGGNILNKYRQAVVRIVNDPKQARWFNADEIAAMQRVIDGNLTENMLRRVGKISPNGNGLMMMLNLMGGAAFGGPALAVTALGVGAKELADRSATGSVDALTGKVMGAAKPEPFLVPGALARAAGYSGGRSK